MPTPPAAPPEELPRSRIRLVLGLILLLTAAIYAPALGNGFTLDDHHAARGVDSGNLPHPLVHELRPIGEYFSSHYWRGTHDANSLFRPVTVLSYALRHAMCGDRADIAHGINLLLHLLAVFLVFTLLRQLGSPDIPRLLGTAIFAMHAIHSEVLAQIVGRAELLGFVFGLGATCLFLQRSLWASVLASCLLFLAFGSKENALAWGGFVVLVAALQGAATRRNLLRAALVVAPPALLFLWLRQRMLDGLAFDLAPIYFTENPAINLPLTQRLPLAISVLGYGLWLTLAPFSLTAEYNFPALPLITQWSDWRFLIAAAVLFAVGVAGLLSFRKQPLWFLAAATFFGFTFITSNIPLAIGTLFAERLYYAPSLALTFLVAGLAWYFAGRKAHWLLIGCVSIWCLACSIVILQRNSVWQDDETLFKHETEHGSRSAKIVLNGAIRWMQEMGAELHRARQASRAGNRAAAQTHGAAAIALREKAAKFVDRAIELDPESADALLHKGSMLMFEAPEIGAIANLDQAETWLRRALQAKHIKLANRSFAHSLLGKVFELRKRPQQAVPHVLASLRYAPRNYDYFEQLLLLIKRGLLTTNDLRQQLTTNQVSQPKEPAWPGYLGVLALQDKKFDTAQTLLRQALAQLPNDRVEYPLGPRLRLALAEALIRTDRSSDAIRLLLPDAKQPFRPDVSQAATATIRRAEQLGR